jgi:hypothetical protein
MRVEFYLKNTFPEMRVPGAETKNLYVNEDGDVVEISWPECADLTDINFYHRDDVVPKIVHQES